jgi:hypothetical protein
LLPCASLPPLQARGVCGCGAPLLVLLLPPPLLLLLLCWQLWRPGVLLLLCGGSWQVMPAPNSRSMLPAT